METPHFAAVQDEVEVAHGSVGHIKLLLLTDAFRLRNMQGTNLIAGSNIVLQPLDKHMCR